MLWSFWFFHTVYWIPFPLGEYSFFHCHDSVVSVRQDVVWTFSCRCCLEQNEVDATRSAVNLVKHVQKDITDVCCWSSSGTRVKPSHAGQSNCQGHDFRHCPLPDDVFMGSISNSLASIIYLTFHSEKWTLQPPNPHYPGFRFHGCAPIRLKSTSNPRTGILTKGT